MTNEINGIWLFAGEGAFCKRKPLPRKRTQKLSRPNIHYIKTQKSAIHNKIERSKDVRWQENCLKE
jgi:hypothetical protein